mmetsp:Transcript_50261/g.166429  ORF Transcript_50261/g.166429 Transcript_50261/m.166429 type:complete len:251 (-) Transcript_50261:143-895(-)
MAWERRRMSKVYRSWSSEARVRCIGSIGFQQHALARVCIVIFCSAEPLETSYSVTPRSAERQQRSECCAGLKRTAVTVSAPHSNDWSASEREVSHSCTVAPEVAKRWSFQWWSTPVNGYRPRYVASGSVELAGALADQSLTVLSSEAETKWWPLREKASPRTKPLCACAVHRAPCRCSVRHHRRISPSHAPETIIESEDGFFAMDCTPSKWPESAPTKGLAKCRSSLTAFTARLYSRAFSNGCSSGAIER